VQAKIAGNETEAAALCFYRIYVCSLIARGETVELETYEGKKLLEKGKEIQITSIMLMAIATL
jgi:hypothetical protein